MLTLAELCTSFILKKSIPYLGKLGEDTEEKLHKEEVRTTCGSTVTKLKLDEETREIDPYVGYTEGIQEVLQGRGYIISNSKLRENSCRKGIYNHGHFGSIYMLYYLRQETDFYSWYRFQDRNSLDYDRSGNQTELYVVYEMPIL